MSWLQKQNAERQDYKNDGEVHHKKTLGDVLRSSITQEWVFLVIFSITVPILIYYLVIDQATYAGLDQHTCSVRKAFQVPCGTADITSKECDRISCCYDSSSQTCYHYLPSMYSYDRNKDTYKAIKATSPFGTYSVKELKLVVNEVNENVVSLIVAESTAETSEANTLQDKNYEVKVDSAKLIVEVLRVETGDVLLTTTKGPLIASDDYWEWTVHITNTTLFGLNQTLIKLDGNETFTKVIYKNKKDHYSSPNFWAYSNGKFHGVRVKHEGPLEITILPSYLIILRSLSGEGIEVEVSLGPTPEDLHQQQSKASDLLPLWALETLTCRKRATFDLAEIDEDVFLDEYSRSNCIDQNLILAMMNDNDTNTELFVNISTKFEEAQQKFVLSLPPQILVDTTLHQKAEDLGILYKYNNKTYVGKYLGKRVVYPDYSNSNAQSFIDELIKTVNLYVNITIDGFILSDNWPAEESFKMDNKTLPYVSKELQEAMSYTIQWNATTPDSVPHLNNHNSYGAYQIKALETYFASTAQPIIMSPTKDLDQSEPIIIENQDATWDNLADQLRNVLFSSIEGNHLVSLPVCGDNKVYDKKIKEDLCVRWYLVAATMPLFRISSPEPWREPSGLYTENSKLVAERALKYRAMLLPIYYTILSRNQPVLRPMFYDFFQDNSTFALDTQYMIGDKLLAAHPFSSDKARLQVYLPQKYEVWYEFFGGNAYNVSKSPWIEIDIVSVDFIMFVAQGAVVPLKDDTTINLVIALNCTSNPCNANSTLLLDNYVDFFADNETVSISNIPYENCNYTLGYIKVYSWDNTRMYTSTGLDLCNGTDVVTVTYDQDNLLK